MRKLSIVLLVGLMLIGGLSVGVYAQDSSDSAKDDVGSSEDIPAALEGDSNVSVNTDVSVNINTIAALYIDHTNVTLGTLDSADFTMSNGESNSGWGDTKLTSDGDLTVYAYSNDSSGYSVSVGATAGGSTDSWSNLSGVLEIDYNDDDSYESLYDGSSFKTIDDVINETDAGFSNTGVSYQYDPDAGDQPGSYTAELTYTIATK